MSPGSVTKFVGILFLGHSTAFHVSLPGIRGQQRLPSFFHDGARSTRSGSTTRSFRARPAVRPRASRLPKATVEDASQTTSALVQDDVLIEPSENSSDEWAYDWRKHWYGVGYEHDFPKGEKPFGVTIFDEPMVLFRDGDGILHCVSDFCPHRASKLSEGMVTDGNIECLYHGWQFDGKTGSCVHVPQLPEGAKPPRAANLRVYPLAIREGVVYVWMGDDPWGEGAKDILPVPCTADDLDKNEPSLRYMFVCDLPYDWSYLAENLVDPAHIPISHHNTGGGGDRSRAGPISFEMIKDGPRAPSPRGFSLKVLNPSFGTQRDKKPSDYRFEAPGIIYVRAELAADENKPPKIFGGQFHTIPLGRGRSRLLFYTYWMNFPRGLKIAFGAKRKFLRHLNSCKILEQDMALICAQEDHVARTGQSLSESFLPIKSSDDMVVELRKWLDHVGHGMPYFTGWKKSKLPVEQLSGHETTQVPKHRVRQSRFYNHVVLSEYTRTALKNIIRVKRASLTAAGVLAAIALLLSCAVGGASPVVAGTAGATAGATAVGGLSRRGWAGIATAVGGAVALGLGAAAQKLEGHFYKNFERHPVLE